MRPIFAALIAFMLAAPAAVADAHPQDGDPAAWCEANSDACATWSESNPEAEICQEPECD